MRHFTKYPSNYVGAASETSGAAMRKKKREIEEKGEAGSELLATDGNWEMWTPKDWYGAMYICKLYGGEKPRWSTCVATDPRYFDVYNKKGPLYIFINRNDPSEKYQSHPATNSWFYDIYDRERGKRAFDKFICEHPAFAKFFDVECDDDVNACGDINCSTDLSDQDYVQAAFAPDFAAGDTADRLVSDGEWELWTPNTFEGSQFLARLYGGQDANWCTAYDKHYFDSYTARGPLYVIVNKNTGEKYQVQPDTGLYFDANDVSIGRAGFNQLCCEHPAIGEFFGVECDDINACGDINCSTDITASDYICAATLTSDADKQFIAADGNYELWQPLTFEGSCELAGYGGDKAKWCTAYRGTPYYFDAYNKRGPLYIVINTANPHEKYQIHLATNSFYDYGDYSLGMEAFDQFCADHPEFAEYFGEYLGADPMDYEDIGASTDIMADRIKTKFDPIRNLLGEDEWGYIQEYLMDVDDRPSLDEILHDVDAWDQYCDWKMQKYHLKPSISAATRIRASLYLR